MGVANIVEREVVGIASRKVKVLAVKLELFAFNRDKSLGNLDMGRSVGSLPSVVAFARLSGRTDRACKSPRSEQTANNEIQRREMHFDRLWGEISRLKIRVIFKSIYSRRCLHV